MAAAAGGIDDAEAVREALVAVRGFGVEAELLDRGVERVLEDELLDEIRGLQEGVLFTDVVGQSFVEIAKEARIPLIVLEVMDEHAVPVNGAPELDQVFEREGGGPDYRHRVVGLVEQAPGDRGHRHGLK